MSHTPGPWKVVRPGHEHGKTSKYRCVQIGKDDSYTTLELLPDDARLIAAAPRMAEALHTVFAWLAMVHAGMETIDEAQVMSFAGMAHKVLKSAGIDPKALIDHMAKKKTFPLDSELDSLPSGPEGTE